jgi:hypothetical protein
MGFYRGLAKSKRKTKDKFEGGFSDRYKHYVTPTGVEDFFFSSYVQTGSGAHAASYPVGTGDPFPGGKARPERDADHSPPSSAEVKNE